MRTTAPAAQSALRCGTSREAVAFRCKRLRPGVFPRPAGGVAAEGRNRRWRATRRLLGTEPRKRELRRPAVERPVRTTTRFRHDDAGRTRLRQRPSRGARHRRASEDSAHRSVHRPYDHPRSREPFSRDPLLADALHHAFDRSQAGYREHGILLGARGRRDFGRRDGTLRIHAERRALRRGRQSCRVPVALRPPSESAGGRASGRA